MTIVAATDDGIHDLTTGDVTLAGRDVECVTRRRDGRRFALVDDGRVVLRSDASGEWREHARAEGDAVRVLHATDDAVLLGTVGAHVWRVDDGGRGERLDAFDAVPGRDRWKNPASAGRPDVWSFASCDGSVFVSVHVGGLWRSDDGGASWVNVLEPDVDVHQVAARDGVVAVSAQGGFATSRDRGETWSWTTDGLHAGYLQSVALSDGVAYVGASSGPFGDDAAVYRASPFDAPFARCSDGLPERFAPIGPYRLAADGEHLAVVSWGDPDLYVSGDGGASWSRSPRAVGGIRSLAVA